MIKYFDNARKEMSAELLTKLINEAREVNWEDESHVIEWSEAIGLKYGGELTLDDYVFLLDVVLELAGIDDE